MRSERGFTLIELLIVVAIIGIISAIGVAQVLRARSAANESAAIGSIRAVLSSQVSYSNACGGGGYAVTLPTLAQPAPGGNIPFLSPDLTSAPVVMKSGYTHTLASSITGVPTQPDCNGTITESGFYATAVPIDLGRTCDRSFALTSSATIWWAPTAGAPTEPFGAPASPLR
jgi:type IV pilus assembly protein PilA